MSENKYCGNCKHFKDEGAYEIGLCGKDGVVTRCGTSCSDYSSKFNGWTELTPDNVDELYNNKERVCVAFECNGTILYILGNFGMTLSTMAKYGGYYYYVLPELKIE